MRPSLLLALVIAALPLSAQQDVGEVRFANSGAAAAQPAFRRGMALLHNFEYESAAEEFRKAEEIDPSFVMAYWGDAMSRTHPIWFQQDLDAARAVLARLAPTREARLARAATPRERDYLAAVEVLYGEGSKNERDFLFADAMAAIQEKYPDDVDAVAFHALAILGTAHQGRDFGTYMRAAALLEEVYPANRSHPGVLHYLIHSYDDPVHAPLGLRAARLYGAVAPEAGHALHMTSHIFVAMGMWDGVIDANQRAIAVVNRQRAERKRARADCGHYVTWLHYGLLQKGRTAEARQTLDECRASALDAPFVSAGAGDSRQRRIDEYSDMRAQHVAAGQMLSPADATIVIPADADFLDARNTIAYGDVLSAAQGNDVSALRTAVARLRSMKGEVLASKKDDDNPSGRIRTEVMLQEAEALLAGAEGKRDEAIALLRSAKIGEEAMPSEFGPPLVAKPSAELLGDFLMTAGRPVEAVAAYRAALLRVPGRAVLVKSLDKATMAAGGAKGGKEGTPAGDSACH